MPKPIDRRQVLALAGGATASSALAGALRAEGMAPGAPLAVPFAGTTPLHCGEAALRVRDLPAMQQFYADLLGLGVISHSADAVSLGVDGTPLLHLLARPAAAIEPRHAAGLYHIAWLMPSRADLARWLVHAAFRQVTLSGFADHWVSEAIYLDDPEGNGIEVYADRPQSSWRWSQGQVAMATDQLDIDGLLALTSTERDSYRQAPAQLRIGHIHLRVGEIAAARGFYETALGLDLTRARGDSAAFLSSGGYHHHLGLNVWDSAGAAARDEGTTGLDWFSLIVRGQGEAAARAQRLASAGFAPQAANGGHEARDPWGTRLRLTAA
ncbi:VOC family protein [Xinfangfangia pollutisoli]|uniref:VOC family protein n=1 Tax=Xinfangfangia pollutisoli TaxID=2865960 RepID=UPI001CD23289|nr:VOC family protein [Xinfangfangia pollutisoli]